MKIPIQDFEYNKQPNSIQNKQYDHPTDEEKTDDRDDIQALVLHKPKSHENTPNEENRREERNEHGNHHLCPHPGIVITHYIRYETRRGEMVEKNPRVFLTH